MQRTRGLFGVFVVMGCMLPFFASAGAYVPVRDEDLIGYFNDFADSFEDYRDEFADTFYKEGGVDSGNPLTTGKSDSIRDLISGANPGGLAEEPCQAGDASDKIWAPSRLGVADTEDADWIYGHYAEAGATATTSPWLAAIEYATENKFTPLPKQIPDPTSVSAKTLGHTRPQVNSSRSLRCLLQELVEWKKLDLSIQIHMLLKEQIADAQASRLSNEQQSKIAAGELEFASKGHCVQYPDGREECSPLIFNQSYVRQESDNLGRVLANRIVAPPGDPVGSANMPTIFQRQAVEQIAAMSSADAISPSDAVGAQPCQAMGIDGYLANEDEYQTFIQTGFARDGASEALSPNLGFFRLNGNPECYKLGALSGVSEAYRNIQQETETEMLRDAQFGNGVMPTREVQDGDPRGISLYSNKPIVQTGDANSAFFRRPSDVTFSTLAECDTVDGCPATSTQAAANQVASYGGALGYNRYELRDTQNAVHATVKELYDTMWYGYFDVHTYTAEWAQAAMLKIYDTMKFNYSRPGVTVSDLPDTSTPDEYEIPPGF